MNHQDFIQNVYNNLPLPPPTLFLNNAKIAEIQMNFSKKTQFNIKSSIHSYSISR
jgi:hypothetical protein